MMTRRSEHKAIDRLVCCASFLLLLSACFRPAPPVEEGDGLDPAYTTEQLPDGSVVVSAGHPVLRKRLKVLSPAKTTSATPIVTATETPTSSSEIKKYWHHEAYIKAANAGGEDFFGTSVSLSGDSLAVGAHGENSNQTTITNGTGANSDNSASLVGAVYVYRRSGVNWTQEAYIKAANAGYEDFFGTSVSLSGDTLAVGAHGENSNQTTITNGTGASSDNSAPLVGAVYVYRRSGVNWTQEAYIKAANAGGEDFFGASVSLSGDVLAVGAVGERSNQTTITNGAGASSDNSLYYSGAVYVYRRSGVNWAQEAYIKAANAGGEDFFGTSVSLSGDTLAVGVQFEDSNQTTITNGTGVSGDNSLSDSGAVYIYRRSGVNWAQEAYIKAANANSSDYFGGSVSLSGDSLAVGAQYEDSNQITITNGTVASGDNSSQQSGAVYIYRRSGVNWAQEAYIKATNAESGDSFGASVFLSGNTLAVGAPYEDSNQTTITNGASASGNNNQLESGAVYVYRRGGVSWSQEAYIKAPNADLSDSFGRASNNNYYYYYYYYYGERMNGCIGISGDTLVVGAPSERSLMTEIVHGTEIPLDNSSYSVGAAYVFRHVNRVFEPDVRVSATSGNSVTFAWHTNLGSASQVKIAPAVNGTASAAENCDGGIVLNAGVTSYTYSGLSSGNKYGFRVCAYSGGTASAGVPIWADTE